jgi:hypothetical protein
MSILDKHGIDIDSAENGVWLTRLGHAPTFKWGTNSYYKFMNDEVMNADRMGGKQGVLDFLSYMKEQLGGVDQVARLEGY